LADFFLALLSNEAIVIEKRISRNKDCYSLDEGGLRDKALTTLDEGLLNGHED